MNSNKNPGPLLITKIRGGAEDFPPEFRAKWGEDIFTQMFPPDVEPFVPTPNSLLLESRVVQERTNERRKVDTYIGGGGPGGTLTGETIGSQMSDLVSFIMLPDGQIGTRTRRLVPEGSGLMVDNLTEDAVQRNLGNSWLDQVITTKPTVFGQNVFSREIKDTTPPRFSALFQTLEQSSISSGTAVDPTLTSGELSERQEQLDMFHKRTTKRFRDLATLPKTIVDSRTNQWKQVETVTQTLELDSTIPAVPTALMDVNFQKLGDGTAVEERITVPDVFSHIRYAIDIPEVIPLEFRVGFAATILEQTIAGTAAPPSLGTGDIAASDEQLTELTHRTSRTSRTISLGSALVGKEWTEEYGGGQLYVIKTLNSNSALTLDVGLNVVSSKVVDLGNTMGIKETRQLITGTWPVLESKKWDPEFQVFAQELSQVVAAGTAPTLGTYFVESTKAIDQYKSLLTRTTRTPTAVSSGTAIISYEWRPFQFPGYVIGPYLSQLKKTTAQLCKHTIRTWWETNATLPTVYDRFTDTCYLVNDVTGSGLERTQDILHDDILVSGFYYSATTPSASQYLGIIALYFGGTLAFTSGSAAVVGTGTNFLTQNVVGDILGIYPWGAFSIASITDATHLTLSSPFGVTGSGPNSWNRASGTPWIGNEKVISAKVDPTDVPGLWKKQTVSVVMR